MDLRVVKTQKAIKDAFMSLRSELPLSKIKVKEICDMALINKSTFYKYYADVYDLSDSLEDEFISSMLAIRQQGSMFDDPELFLNSVQDLISHHSKELDILFRDRQHIFLAKTNHQLFENLHETEEEKAITATMFVMGGLAFTNFALKDLEGKQDDDLHKNLITYISAVGNTLKSE